MDDIAALPDAEILAGVKRLRRRELDNTAALIAHLVQVEGRGLYAEVGYSSMFRYLTGALGYPEDAAAKRARVARLVRKVPVVLDYLADGRLHLSGAVVLAPHLASGDAEGLLDRAAGHSRRELERLVADLAPKPSPAIQVRRLPQPSAPAALGLGLDGGDPPRGGSPAAPIDDFPPVPAGSSSPFDVCNPPRGGSPVAAPGGDPPRGGSSSAPRVAGVAASMPAPAAAMAPTPRRPLRDKTQPLGRDQYRVAFTASAATVGKLERLAALLSHQVPSGDLDACLDRALDVAIGVLEKERFGSPRKRETQPSVASSQASGEPGARTRHVPAATRRAVFDRDGGRCAYVAPDGRRCGESRWLEIHHAGVAFALGGSHDVDNLALFCRTHNQWAGQKIFGEPPERPSKRSSSA